MNFVDLVPDTRPCPLCGVVVRGAVTADGKFLPVTNYQHDPGCPNFRPHSWMRRMGGPSAPLDFFKSVTWLANIGHVLAGYAVVVTAAVWSASFIPSLWASGGLLAYAVAKEYVIDLVWESGEDVKSSTIDFLGYTAGALVAWVEVLAKAGAL